MKRVLTFALAGILAVCCNDPVDVGSEEQIPVIDGWIDDGGYPVVMVSTSFPINTKYEKASDIRDHIGIWANVTVSDGEKTVALTGMKDKRYFPPYIYTTSRIKGEAGKTYTLTVRNKGVVVTAKTRIPEPVTLHGLEAKPMKEFPGYDVISAGFADKPGDGDRYKCFVMIEGRDSIYKPSFLGNLSDENFSSEEVSFPILPSLATDSEVKRTCFPSGCTVLVKFCTLEDDVYQYWSDFEEVLNLSRNMMFPVCHDIRSNIKGGLGLWAGYGATYYRIKCP